MTYVVINSKLYSVQKVINQRQQMPTIASRISWERQAKNLLAQSCPLLTQMMR